MNTIKHFKLLAFALLLIWQAGGAFAATCTSLGDGLFSSASTWSCGQAPGPEDRIVIKAGHDVILDQNYTNTSGTGGQYAITIEAGATFKSNGNYLLQVGQGSGSQTLGIYCAGYMEIYQVELIKSTSIVPSTGYFWAVNRLTMTNNGDIDFLNSYGFIRMGILDTNNGNLNISAPAGTSVAYLSIGCIAGESNKLTVSGNVVVCITDTNCPLLTTNGGTIQLCTPRMLPIKFYSLQAVYKKEHDAVDVKWITEQEIDSKHFMLERSADGIEFTEINAQNASGNSNVHKTYSYKDKNANAGTNYYRVKEHSADGSVSYSVIVKADKSHGYSPLMVYPNPLSENNFSAAFHSETGKSKVSVINALQQVMYESAFVHGLGNVSIEIPSENLPNGMYFVRIYSGNRLYTGKLLVHK